MKRLALAVQTFPGGNATLKRHWENFKLSGADEFFIATTTDGGCWVPDGVSADMIGANLYCIGSHLPRRLLRTIQKLRDSRADWFCVAEYDVLFLKPIPRDLPEGLTTHLAGNKPQGCHCNEFYHGPWIMDRETADVVVQTGYEIIASKLVDPSPDCFLGQIVEKAKISVHSEILKSYSRNTIHGDVWTAEARCAADAGAVSIHGVKDKQVFDALTK